MLRRLSNSSLSISEVHMLECIGKHGEAVNATDIAQELDITPPSVTAMLKRLEKKGFISKDRSDEDGRRVRIALTNEGRRAEVAHRYFHRKMVRAMTSDLTQAERDAIMSGLQKLNAFLQAGLADCAAGKDERL